MYKERDDGRVCVPKFERALSYYKAQTLLVEIKWNNVKSKNNNNNE